jgi:hypothetical protein
MATKKVVKAKVESSLEDLLNEVSASIDEAPAAKDEEKNRPVFPQELRQGQIMTEFAGVSEAHNLLKERKDILGSELKSTVWEEFTNQWFIAGSKPSNPKIESKINRKADCQAIYQCRTNFKVQYREGLSGRNAVIDPLKEVGISDEIANKIFDENLEIVVENSLRPFNELAQGSWVSGEFSPSTDVQKSAAKKLLNFVIGKESEPLTSAERVECLVKETRYEVKAGFLDRAAYYCNSANQLRALLTVIKPGEAISHVKFAQSDTEADKNGRLENIFHHLLFGEAEAA